MPGSLSSTTCLATTRGAARDPSSATAIACPDLTRKPTAVMSLHQVGDLVECHRMPGERRVGALRFQLAGRVAHNRQRRAHRPGTEADARDTQRLEVADRRRVFDGEDVDGTANPLHELRDRVAIAYS